MFFFKKAISPLLYPLSLILIFLIIGLFLIWFTRRSKAGKIFLTVGTGLLCLLSYDFVPHLLLKPLEQRYPAFTTEHDVRLLIPPSTQSPWIVVLGGGHITDEKIPATSQLSESSLFRLIEGVRIHRLLPGSKMYLSGGAVYDDISEAELMRDVAVALGVSQNSIVLDTTSRDTREQALNITKATGGKPLLLVTSASHLPRSMLLFTDSGCSLLPIPSHHLAKQKKYTSPRDYYPSPENLLKSERAIHEYLGIFVAKLFKSGL